MKDVDRRRDIDDEQENGTNGDDRKGSSVQQEVTVSPANKLIICFSGYGLPNSSP